MVTSNLTEDVRNVSLTSLVSATRNGYLSEEWFQTHMFFAILVYEDI